MRWFGNPGIRCYRVRLTSSSGPLRVDSISPPSPESRAKDMNRSDLYCKYGGIFYDELGAASRYSQDSRWKWSVKPWIVSLTLNIKIFKESTGEERHAY